MANWYHSEKLGCYVSLAPLKISQAVKDAADHCSIQLDWDDNGNIVNLNFDQARNLMEALGGFLLTPAQYWALYHEAESSDELMHSLNDSSFAEILDRVYLPDHTWIDHPVIKGNFRYEGIKHSDWPVEGRPGWITPDDIDSRTGHPFRIREKGTANGLIKYWSPKLDVTSTHTCCAMRGYVTSVAMMSLDLGIPVNSSQKKLMARLCTKNPPEEYFSEEETELINHACMSCDPNELERFISSPLFEKIKSSSSSECLSVTETVYDHAGLFKVKHPEKIADVISITDFDQWLYGLKNKFKAALDGNKTIYFVCGHQNPDSDAVVSSLLEAFRFYLSPAFHSLPLFPYVQAQEMPGEIEKILGKKRSAALLYEKDLDITSLMKEGRARFIFTDQNYQADLQKYVICITDHHERSASLESTLPIPCHIEPAGSCTGLVTRKYLGMGYLFDKELSDIAYGAMLMDTEDRNPLKMTPWDLDIMNLIRKRCAAQDDARYSSLMHALLSETDPVRLYRRDYKKFNGFGFAVLKVCADEEDSFSSFPRLAQLASKDNEANAFSFTLLKYVVYAADGIEVMKERIYYVFHKNTESALKDKLKELLFKIIQLSFPEADIAAEDDYIESSNVHRQLSRKKIAPAVEMMLKYSSQYTYFSSIHKWVERDFLRGTEAVRNIMPDIHCDGEGRVCSIDFLHARALCGTLHAGMLSLKEYWDVYFEAKESNDSAMLASLTNPDFIEFLDTCSNHGIILNHPVCHDDTVIGEAADAEIIPASPGLILPEEIDRNTGLPMKVHAPNEINPYFWRYWSPASDDLYLFSRSYIFLLSQPCLDAKTKLSEGFASMGIRLVRDSNLKINIRIETDRNTLKLYYSSEMEPSEILIYQAGSFAE